MLYLLIRNEVEDNTGLIVATWLTTALSTIAFGAKLFARIRRFKRLYWDDFWVTLAWANAVPLCVSTYLILQKPHMRNGYDINVFLSRPIGQMLFYNVLWAIKISFLVFFRRLIPSHLKPLRLYWIVALTITIITYGGIWGTTPYQCWVKKGLNECERDPAVIKAKPVALGIAAGLIAFTDGLILVIPFVILSKVKQVSRNKKFILYALFSLQMITIIVPMIRCVFATTKLKSDRDFQVKWLSFLAHIEADIALTVACIGSLRSLFTQDGSSTQSGYPNSNEQSSQSNKNRYQSPLPTSRIQLRSWTSRSQEHKDSMELPLSNHPAPPPR
ncbi:hypothetical protein DM02DRAFT_712082 [Periconia macrospinosa]|uniref:Rhodopsin domain-containing protein n=1 Tax=Periconia macrospinosa TaxID=97972 RepID=A0A2V1DME0_9PLEO|nr:hypothetical protein DM02DRAFT_712082 [Periconia macrospinosa]